MKYLLSILAVLLINSTAILAQEIAIKVHFQKPENSMEGGVIVAQHLVTDALVTGQTDPSGNFLLRLPSEGNYRVKLWFFPQNDTTFFVNLGKDSTARLMISYPPKKCQYEITKLQGVCPQRNHSNDVVPIVYGLPAPSTMREAKRKKIHLGGCVISDCDPYWYCKIHQLSF